LSFVLLRNLHDTFCTRCTDQISAINEDDYYITYHLLSAYLAYLDQVVQSRAKKNTNGNGSNTDSTDRRIDGYCRVPSLVSLNSPLPKKTSTSSHKLMATTYHEMWTFL